MQGRAALGLAGRRGLCLWAALLPLLLAALPSAWHRCRALAERAQSALRVAAGPQIVVIAPEPIFVQTSMHSDGLRTIIVAAGLDERGCIRYAGSSEALASSAEPLTVYLRSLPLPDCMGSQSP